MASLTSTSVNRVYAQRKKKIKKDQLVLEIWPDMAHVSKKDHNHNKIFT